MERACLIMPALPYGAGLGLLSKVTQLCSVGAMYVQGREFFCTVHIVYEVSLQFMNCIAMVYSV